MHVWTHVYRFSGKTYNEYGRFKDCREGATVPSMMKNENRDSIEYKYYLLTCKEDRCSDKFPIPMNLGLCVPSVCNPKQIMDAIVYFLPILHTRAAKIVFGGIDGVKILEPGKEIKPEELELIDAFEMNNDASKFRFGNFLIVAFVFSMFALTKVSTFIKFWRDKKNKTLPSKPEEEKSEK